MVTWKSKAPRGFTLVETMAVVIIIGVLATLAVYGVRKYVYSAKSSEARTMILNIKAAEEAYREETYQYLPTATSIAGTSELYPHVCVGKTPGQIKVAWEQSAGCGQAGAFRTLGVTSTNPVQYGYGVAVPSAAGASMPVLPLKTAFDWADKKAPNGPAFAVLAMGDLDGNGTFSMFVSSNFTDEVYAENDSE